jgi:hypothetical protein
MLKKNLVIKKKGLALMSSPYISSALKVSIKNSIVNFFWSLIKSGESLNIA